jgi:4-hydroxy-tetrahydrodipicolinate reductase
MTNIAVIGAAGRMGMRLVALSKQYEALKLAAATEREGHPALGQDAGEIAGVGKMGVALASQLPAGVNVVIDFTAPVATRALIPVCRQKKIAMVIGTTGLTAGDHALIDEAAKEIAIIQAPNMSLGINLLFKVAAQMAKVLGDDYDLEITELHHRFKKDAPSGTALGIADAILKATGKTRDDLVFDRHGDDCTRKRGQIGMQALRVGDEVGKHTVYFGALGERLELTHTATTRDTFVHGALKAAIWLGGKPAGRYTMADVLGL